MTNTTKQALRQYYRHLRANLALEYQETASQQICKRIENLQGYRQAQHIALYHATNGEINLTHLWHTASLAGKICYFPYMQLDHSLIFLPATPTTNFIANRYGILEPNINKIYARSVHRLDLICMPVVAFDLSGNRVGMGGGYYDRSLVKLSPLPLLLGVAYEFQRQFKITPDTWDIPLHTIVTPNNIFPVTSS